MMMDELIRATFTAMCRGDSEADKMRLKLSKILIATGPVVLNGQVYKSKTKGAIEIEPPEVPKFSRQTHIPDGRPLLDRRSDEQIGRGDELDGLPGRGPTVRIAAHMPVPDDFR